MDYRDIDWSADRPDHAEFARDWDRTIIRVLDIDTRLAAVVDALGASHVNGGAQILRVTIEAGPAVRWALERNRLNEYGLLDRFFRDPIVCAALPAVAVSEPKIEGFRMENVFASYGWLAGNIAGGGAYRQFSGNDEQVLAMTSDFMRAVCDLRLSETFAWVNWSAWTSWFHGIAWDGTFLWFDKRTGTMTVLLITDTD